MFDDVRPNLLTPINLQYYDAKSEIRFYSDTINGMCYLIMKKVLENCVARPWRCLRLDVHALTADKTFLELAFFSAVCYSPAVLLVDDLHKIRTHPETVTVSGDNKKTV